MRVKKRLLPQWVTRYTDRHGKARYRFRRTGFKPHTFKHEPGTNEFLAEYEACKIGAIIEIGKDRAIKGSLRDLLNRYYRSQSFKRAADITQLKNRGILEMYAKGREDRRVAAVKFEHIDAHLAKRAETHPSAARNLRKQLRRLFDYAKKIEMRPDNPVDGVEMPPNPSKGHHTWTEPEIEQYQAKHPLGSKARLALELMLWTGNRRGDAVHLGSGHVKDGRLEFTQEKTGKEMKLLLAPQLAAAIAAMPPHDGETFLVTEYGRPFSVAGFGGRFRKWCDEAGLPHCSAHGLRKAMARRLAEIDKGNQQIKSVTGHSSDSEVAHYTRQASQMLMADAAIRDLSTAHLATAQKRLAELVGKTADSLVELKEGGGPGGTDVS